MATLHAHLVATVQNSAAQEGLTRGLADGKCSCNPGVLWPLLDGTKAMEQPGFADLYHQDAAFH